MPESSDVRISVVIPCLDAGGTLRRQLDALMAQRSPVPFEVIVADNGSSDDSIRIAAEYAPHVLLVDASHARGINVARNAGLRKAGGELLLLCDADDRVHPGWLAAYWEAFCAGGTLFGGALRRIADDGTELQWQRALNDGLQFLPWPTGANCGLARSAAVEIGDLDESLRGGADETDFFWRAQLLGHELRFVPDAGIDYVARPSTSGVFAQSRAFGRSHVVLFARYRTAGMPRPHVVRSALVWLRLLRAVIRSRSDRAAFVRLVRYSGVLWGRLKGSAEHRVFYV